MSRGIFAAVEQGDVQVVTSTLTLTEVLVHPYRYGNQALAREYSDILLHARNVRTIPVSPEIAATAARLRALHGIRTPDAIQLEVSQQSRATAFLTNDEGLEKATGLRVLVLKQLLP